MSRFSDIDIETSDSADINLSPLIDMMFLLLIFFMVTSAFVRQTSVEIEEPEVTAGSEVSQDHIQFALTEGGNIHYDGKPINIDRVRARVSRLVDQKTRPVVIKADSSSRTNALMQLVAECREGGAHDISVATEPKQQAKRR